MSCCPLTPATMTTPPSLFHALLRPSILQILRATGYHSTRPAVLDSLTDMAARYLSLLCERTASHATHNSGDGADFTIAEVRLALQDVGALLPQTLPVAEDFKGEEDLRGVEEFIQFFSGQRMKEMMEFGNGDGESDATDYLNALKKKHSKTGDDSKYHGTLLGKGNEVGEIFVEGGPETSIDEWISKRTSPPAQQNGVLSDADSPLSDAPLKLMDEKSDSEDDSDDKMDLV
ncbi:TAF(II) complex (TBP-associated complex) component [Paramyrothecium foliicola]|nr:TAF(II) complex (TBP-associated complex) component [Paramyrothecium foliicola]